MATSEADPVVVASPDQRPPAPVVDAAPKPRRLASIDAYRGLVMFLLLAEVLELGAVAAANEGSRFWEILAHHQEHVPWVGCSVHDMIQPSFSFLVGVALPFSLAGRAMRGQSRRRVILHALWRALVLVGLGIFLRSMRSDRTNFTFEDTLTQIGLGYPFLFLLGLRPRRDQVIALVVILVGYWAAFALYPVPGSDFDYTKVGVPADWRHHASGFEAHWNKNANLASDFDRWFLNLFPRKDRFAFNGGGYVTLSFIPTLGTMILGLLAGGLLIDPTPKDWAKVAWLVVGGALVLAAGWGLGYAGVCPIVKRIWTPSWVLFSGGICLMVLGVAYAAIDLLGSRVWVLPLVVVGMNSIAAYLLSWLAKGWVRENLRIHLGKAFFHLFGDAYAVLFEGACVLAVLWLMLWWMYRRGIFLRI
jgi:predicted acyltransferase